MTNPSHSINRSYIVELPVEDFLAITELVKAATDRNNDVRIKGFYLKVLENLQAGWVANQDATIRSVK